MKKVVVIGPVYPYKGGIAHYTGLLCRALEKRFHVTMVSYKMQYPKILFKREQKDYENNSFEVKDTKYWVNTINIFNWLTVSGKIKREKPDIILIQWWHPYFAPCYFVLARLLRRFRIIFICHNVLPHERFPLDKQFTKIALRQGKAFIVQSRTDGEALKEIIPNAVFKQTVHPTYNAFKFEGMSEKNARKKLGIGDTQKVLLFFGFVREYKGLRHLIKAMPDVIAQIKDIKLLIVGDFDQDKDSYLDLIKMCNLQSYVEIADGYIPDREVEKYFAACDLVVLPYESATQSGIVQIAYGFGKPVIVTDVGGLPDVVSDGKTGYVVEAGRPDRLAEAVIKFYAQGKEADLRENIRKEASRFSWDKMAEAVEELSDELGRTYDK